jgi:hypothetical protein
MGIVFPIGDGLENTSVAVKDDPTVFLSELGCAVKTFYG